MSANDHQYALSWSNYTSHLKNAFDSLLTGNEFVDVTLSCEGRKISAHKMLLSACSTYFHDLFRDNPCQHPIVIFRDIKFQDLTYLLTFMYSGEVSVPTENLDSFLKTAELLHISGLNGEQPITTEPNDKTKLSQHTQSLLKRHQETLEASTDERNCNPNTSEENINKKPKLEMDSTVITEIKQEQVEVLNPEPEEFQFDDPLSLDNMDLLQPFMENLENLEELYGPTENEETAEMTTSQLPNKSRKLYEAQFEYFKKWCDQKNVQKFTENVLLTYFLERSKQVKSSTLWAQFSMLKTMLLVKNTVNIGKYPRLLAFLKRKNEGYKPTKSKTLTIEQVNEFLTEAPDDEFLMIKVALIFGISGACRGDELLNLSVDDVEDLGSSIICNVKNTKNGIDRTFVVRNSKNNAVGFVELCRKYITSRKVETKCTRFFLRFYKNACTAQPVGKNTIGKLPQKIATFLNLPDSSSYTGHCFRRTSASLLADARADVDALRRHQAWQSTTLAESSFKNNDGEQASTSSSDYAAPSFVQSLDSSIVDLDYE